MIEANFNVAFTNDEVNRKWLCQLLSDGVVAVKFTKKDGTDRTLMCIPGSSLTVRLEVLVHVGRGAGPADERVERAAARAEVRAEAALLLARRHLDLSLGEA